MAINPKLLIVEDHHLTLSLLGMIFSSFGFEVTCIERGDKALPYLGSNNTDVIILDLELPGMTGDQIYKHLKSDPALRHIPVVPFTAHKTMESESSLSRRLTSAGVIATGHVPHIVYKDPEAGGGTNITKEIVDEVTRALLDAGQLLPAALVDHYKKDRGIDPEKIPLLFKDSKPDSN